MVDSGATEGEALGEGVGSTIGGAVDEPDIQIFPD